MMHREGAEDAEGLTRNGLHLVFDLDGTLIDSATDVAASASELVTTFGGRPLETSDVIGMIGDGAALLVRRALAAAGLDPETPHALARFLEIYDRRLLEHTVPYPGMEDALRLASRRARLSVLTNKPLAPSHKILAGLGLASYFENVIGGDGPLGRKPDPAGLRSLGNGRVNDVVLVGDSPIDWATAQAAACPFVWARYGFGGTRFGDAPPETPYVLDSPGDLAAVIDRVGAIMQGA